MPESRAEQGGGMMVFYFLCDWNGMTEKTKGENEKTKPLDSGMRRNDEQNHTASS